MSQPRSQSIEVGVGDALIVIDVQKDFLEGGALPVPGGDRVIEPLNRYVAAFAQQGLVVIATRDWHPPTHCSFSEQGGSFPVHCVAGSAGASFPEQLRLPHQCPVVDKAVTPDREDFSGFGAEGLQARLASSGIDRLFVGGLATEYCVLETVLDGLDRGYAVVVLVDAIAAMDRRPRDGARAIERMTAAGARFVSLDKLGL